MDSINFYCTKCGNQTFKTLSEVKSCLGLIFGKFAPRNSSVGHWNAPAKIAV